MKALALVAALLLAGCASAPRDVDVLEAALDCLFQGKILAFIKIDEDQQVIDRVCLTVRYLPKPEAYS